MVEKNKPGSMETQTASLLPDQQKTPMFINSPSLTPVPSNTRNDRQFTSTPLPTKKVSPTNTVAVEVDRQDAVECMGHGILQEPSTNFGFPGVIVYFD
jgi:hypothetical protein